jgi:hypothetical protein
LKNLARMLRQRLRKTDVIAAMARRICRDSYQHHARRRAAIMNNASKFSKIHHYGREGNSG